MAAVAVSQINLSLQSNLTCLLSGLFGVRYLGSSLPSPASSLITPFRTSTATTISTAFDCFRSASFYFVPAQLIKHVSLIASPFFHGPQLPRLFDTRAIVRLHRRSEKGIEGRNATTASRKRRTSTEPADITPSLISFRSNIIRPRPKGSYLSPRYRHAVEKEADSNDIRFARKSQEYPN